MKSLIFLLMIMSSAAFAAGQGGSGGVGFQCDSQIYLADTYAMLYQSGDEVILKSVELLNQMPQDRLLNTLMDGLRSYLEQGNEEVQFQEIETAKNQLSFVYKDKVRRTYDDHITVVPCGSGPVIQLARQNKQGLVELANITKQMSPLEQTMLKIHEIRLRWLINRQKFQGDTTPVRNWVDKFGHMTLSTLINFVIIKPLEREGSTGLTGILPSCEKQILLEAEKELIRMGLPKEDYFSRPLTDTAGTMGPIHVTFRSHDADGTDLLWSAMVRSPELPSCEINYAAASPVNLPTYKGDYVDKASQEKWDKNQSWDINCSATIDESFVNQGGKKISTVKITARVGGNFDKPFSLMPGIVAEIPWSQVKLGQNLITGSVQNASGTTGFSISLAPETYMFNDSTNVKPQFRQEANSVRIWSGTQQFECKDIVIHDSWL